MGHYLVVGIANKKPNQIVYAVGEYSEMNLFSQLPKVGILRLPFVWHSRKVLENSCNAWKCKQMPIFYHINSFNSITGDVFKPAR